MQFAVGKMEVIGVRSTVVLLHLEDRLHQIFPEFGVEFVEAVNRFAFWFSAIVERIKIVITERDGSAMEIQGKYFPVLVEVIEGAQPQQVVHPDVCVDPARRDLKAFALKHSFDYGPWLHHSNLPHCDVGQQRRNSSRPLVELWLGTRYREGQRPFIGGAEFSA
jgi:hypothetical protein